MELICTRDNVSNTNSWNQKIFRMVASSREKNFQGFAFDFCHVASGISPNPLACLRRWNFPYGISRRPPRLAWNVTTYVTSCGQILRPVPRDSINFDRGCRLNSSWIVWRDRVGPDPTPLPTSASEFSVARQIPGIIRHRLIMAAVQRFDYYLSNSSFAPLPVADRSIKATALIKATSAELIIPSWLWSWLSARVTKHLRSRNKTRGKFCDDLAFSLRVSKS